MVVEIINVYRKFAERYHTRTARRRCRTATGRERTASGNQSEPRANSTPQIATTGRVISPSRHSSRFAVAATNAYGNGKSG